MVARVLRPYNSTKRLRSVTAHKRRVLAAFLSKPVRAAGAKAVLALFLTALLTGGSTVAVRIGITQMAPFWGAAVRFACASPILLAVAAARRSPLPRSRALLGPFALGILNFGAANALTYFGLQAASPGLAQLIATLNPIFTLLFARLHRLEKLRPATVFGMIFGILGVVLIIGTHGSAASPVAVIMLVGAAAASAEGYVLVRQLPGLDPVTTAAVAMLVGALLLFCLSFSVGEPHVLPHTFSGIASLVYNIVLGSVALFALYLWLLKTSGAARASYVFLLAPVAAVCIATWLIREPVTLGLIVGGIVVLIGVYLGVIRDVLSQPDVPSALAGAESIQGPEPVECSPDADAS
jgi:drug/metabolite transporter (DMT)-like permease